MGRSGHMNMKMRYKFVSISAVISLLIFVSSDIFIDNDVVID